MNLAHGKLFLIDCDLIWKWLVIYVFILSNTGTWAIKAHSSKHLSSTLDWLTALTVCVIGWGQSSFSRLVCLFLKQLKIQKQVFEHRSEDVLVPSPCIVCTFEFKSIQTCICWKSMLMIECKVLMRLSINKCWANKWKLLKEQEIICSALRSLLYRRIRDYNLKSMAERKACCTRHSSEK